MIRKTSYTKGIFAEYLACVFLFVRGYQILSIRYKTKLGEIDIIARKSKSIHFVEVKLRQNADKAKLAITSKNKQRVINAAKLFLQRNKKYANFALSFDAIAVTLPLKVAFIKNAWSE